MPIMSDSRSTQTPRTKGSLRQGSSAAFPGKGYSSHAMAASGLRTATAQDAAPRIMTPSMTAWPPIEGLLATKELDLRERAPAVLTLEALHPSPGVDQLLLARVEGVALRADL